MFSRGRSCMLGALGSLVLCGQAVNGIELDLTNAGAHQSPLNPANVLQY